jgi:hypothetical protein
MAIAVHISVNRQDEFLSLSFSNIEALAFECGRDINCIGVGSIDCPKGHTKVRLIME